MSENENKAAVVDLANLEEENSSELPDSFSKNEKEEFRKTQKKILFKVHEMDNSTKGHTAKEFFDS